MKLIDTACPKCGQVVTDVFVMRLEPALLPLCECGAQVERAWLSAPSVTPQGTRPERNTDKAPKPSKVDVKAIARDTTFEVEQKWTRYSDPKLAEQHISREINHKAGIADETGNKLPDPKPAPFQVLKSEIPARHA